MLSAGLAVEPPHRVGHGLGSSLGAGLGGGLGAALGAGLGPPSHHPMLQAFSGEFLRPMPPHRWVPGEPGPGATMFSPPADLRFWLHHQQHQHLARYAAASQSVSHHRLPPQSQTPSPQPPPAPAPPPAPSPAPVNLSAGHKEDKDRHAHSSAAAASAAMSYHYTHYPMAAPMFPPAPYSPYGSRLPPPESAPAAYSPPAGSPAPLPPPSHPAPRPAAASKTFKVPVPAGPPSGAKDSPKHRGSHAAKHSSISTSTSMLPPLASSTPIMATTATPHHSLHAAPAAQEYLHPALAGAHAPASAPAPAAAAAATTLPQFWKGTFIRLASGELKRVQEMKAEDFVASAERNPTLRADPATVVRIQSTVSCRVSIALSVAGSESEIETTSEHPFFVYGNGWASCSPERSLQLLGLSCRTLQVGDVVVSLTHRQQPQQQQQQQAPPPPKAPQRPQASAGSRGGRGKKQQQAVNLPPPTGHPRTQHLPGPGPASTPSAADTSAASMAGKKRRWSAPDQLAAAAAEEAQQAAAQAAAQGIPSKLARVPE